MMKELDRVRCSSSDQDNLQIEKSIQDTLNTYRGKSQQEITQRIIKIEKEWSIERWLELNASTLAFIGVILGVFIHLYWLFLPTIVLPFLALHAIQGWCPPLPIMRKLKIRTRREIDWEKFSLKFIRGDFQDIADIQETQELLKAVKKIT
jgi:hypothetical protein